MSQGHHGHGHHDDTLTRRNLLKLAAAASLGVGVAPILAACGNAGAGSGTAAGGGKASDKLLRVGYLPITDATPLLLAHADGIFEKNGLDVPRPTLLRSWPALAEVFQAGKVDVVHILMPLALQLRFQHDAAVKVVAWNHTGGSALTAAHRITSVDQLAGETIAIPGWYSIHNVALQILLRGAGLTSLIKGEPSRADKTVKLIVMAPPDMVPALAQGSIAAFIVADPFNALAEEKGAGKILRFTGDIWRGHACCVTAVREELLRDRPDVARAAVDSLVQAQLSARNDRDRVAGVLSDGGYLPQPRDAIAAALTKDTSTTYEGVAIQHPQWKERRIDFQGFPFASYTSELVDQLRKTTIDGDTKFLATLDGARAHRELVDDRLVRAAIGARGGPEAFDLPASLTRREEVAP